MALEKRVVEFPFDKGIEQKIAIEVAPDGLMDQLENVDLSKVGKYVKRNGFTAMTTTSLGPGSITFGNVLKLASREDQLIAISSNPGGLGSGAGAGSSGDTIFSYSDELVGWKPHAKIQRPTIETLYSFTQDSSMLNSADVAKGGDIAVFGFRRFGEGRIVGGIYAHVIDISSDVVVMDSILLQSHPWGNAMYGSVKCLCHNNLHFIFWIAKNTGPGEYQLYYSVYDRTNHAAGFLTPVAIIAHGGFDITEFDVCSDTNNIYIVWRSSGLNNGAVKYAAANPLASPTNVAISTGGAGLSISCSTNGIKLHVAFIDNGTPANIKICQIDNTAFTIDGNNTVIAVGTTKAMALVASLSSTECWVFSWEDAATLAAPPVLRWIRLTNAAAGTTSGSVRDVINVKPTLKPFFLNNRLFIGLSGYDQADIIHSDYGHTLCEIDVLATSSTITDLATLFPVAAWDTDVAAPWIDVINSCPNGSFSSNVLYVASSSFFRSSDVFVSQTTTNPVGAFAQLHESGFKLMALDFANPKKWQAARHGEGIIFGGALPYYFDGLHAFECGFIWRPSILSHVRNTGAAVLPQNVTLQYRATYEYWDTIQRRWQSCANVSTELLVATGTDTNSVDVVIRAPTVTAMPRGGAYFFGSVRISLWRSTSAAPEEFIFVGQVITEQFSPANYTISDASNDAAIQNNERLYLYGGELENYAPPPCISIAAHRDRVFAINSTTNELWYTKPLINKRGVEWSRYQKLPLFEKGMALASLESALLIFTVTGVYALQGSGPSINGLPPDAFSKLYQISSEIGCVERNAAFKTPVGVIFRARQGLWLIDKSMSLRYIGGPVETFMSDVSEMLSGDIDEAKGCIRFLVRKGSIYYVLNFWYDTNRWSYDTCASDTLNTSVYHGGVYYQNRTAVGGGNTAGVWKRSAAYADVADFYSKKVRSHWLRFGNMAQLKRVWRVLATVMGQARATLQIVLEKNLNTGSVQTETFTYVGQLDSSNNARNHPRVHLAHQKITALRVTLAELEEGGVKDTAGIDYLGLSFELGMKRGAVKMRQELSR